MTVAAGKAAFELTLYRSGKELNTANFTVYIERAALDKDTVSSKSQTRELSEIEDNAEELLAAARTMAEAQEALSGSLRRLRTVRRLRRRAKTMLRNLSRR